MPLLELYDFGNLPFNTGTYTRYDAYDLPHKLPFKLGIDSNSGRLVQMPNKTVSIELLHAYSSGSLISGFMEDKGIGYLYCQDFLDFVLKYLGKEKIYKSNILEIGCGTGYLLSRLKEYGAHVAGIEPGSFYENYDYGVEIIRDFFPTKMELDRFDIVIQYALLEHMEEPEAFLKSINDILVNDGILLISVPACDSYLETGDISILFHEHWSYFTQITLFRTLANSGFLTMAIEYSKMGSAWYVVAKRSTNLYPVEDVDKISCITDTFLPKMYQNLDCFQSILKDISQRSLGIYCPARILNHLSILMEMYDYHNIRFFDDNPSMFGKYFLGFPPMVENMNMLLEKPVDTVFIASNSFYNSIKHKLRHFNYGGAIRGFNKNC